MKARGLAVVTLVCLLLAFSAQVLAHGGGLDSYGGHNDRKNGGYHLHRGPLAGRSFPSQAVALKALRSSQERAKPAAGPLVAEVQTGSYSQEERLQALVALLVKKGVIKNGELEAALRGN